jgi:glutamate-1-semialdehyde 2,1-aminomutase
VKFPMEKSRKFQNNAMELIPLGVNSNFRYWGIGVTPYFSKAKGGYLWDVDGNRFIDYRLAFGPIILGHANEEVNSKVHEEIDRAVLCAMTGELEIDVAQMIVEMCPAVEMVRLACSGTEATMHAIRVARAYSGREKIIKFEGMYHGFQDYTLFSTYAPATAYGNLNSPISIPASSGIPKALNELIITLPFNNLEVLENTLRRIGYEVAAIIAEPCMGNCGAIEPLPGFLEYIREKCTEYGIIFILDEVKTGFRIANGGAQEYYSIKPDLATYAKAIGNGYPIAAFGGKREIMSIIGHGVAQGGTYNNNMPGVAAAYATLKILKERPVLATISKRGRHLIDGLKLILAETGLPFCINGYPTMFSFALGRDKVTNQRDWDSTDKDSYQKIIEAAMERGVMPDNDPREPWFLCYAHSDADVDETLNVMQDAIRVINKNN